MVATLLLNIITIKADEISMFYDMFMSHGSIMYMVDIETGRFVDVNRAALSFYGYTRQEMLSMYIYEINRLDPDIVKDAIKKASDREQTYFSIKHYTADNEKKFVNLYTYPVVLNERDVLFSVISDVTYERQLVNRNRWYLGIIIILILIK